MTRRIELRDRHITDDNYEATSSERQESLEKTYLKSQTLIPTREQLVNLRHNMNSTLQEDGPSIDQPEAIFPDEIPQNFEISSKAMRTSAKKGGLSARKYDQKHGRR